MNFRTQILVFFFLFGFVPLLLAVVINLPLVLERTELFYYKAYVQSLTTDFRDLDQHIAGRHEMVRLLAKLPEPGALQVRNTASNLEDMDLARAKYTAWVNGILKDQEDIVQIIFFDAAGKKSFWLVRNGENGGWEPTTHIEGAPGADYIERGLSLNGGEVEVSPIVINHEAGQRDASRYMTMRLISPVKRPGTEESVGAVVIHVNVGGMARYDNHNFWVLDSGQFLAHTGPDAPVGNAFEAYHGLEKIFAKNETALWMEGNQRAIWIPMFRTEMSGPLWIGRLVDATPLAEFRNTLVLRVMSIVLILVIAILLAARWFALRADRFSHELTDGIRRILQGSDDVEFYWRGPKELTELGNNLSELARKHTSNIRELKSRAQELEASNQYKSEFLANVSHELRTPLNSILLLSKILYTDEKRLDPETIQQARVIHEAGQDLRSLIENILDISRIEARKTSFSLDWLDLVLILNEVVMIVEPQFKAKNLPLILEIEDQAPTRIYSDGEKVRQVLKNFLSNALKFTDQGEVHLTLKKIDPDNVGIDQTCDCTLQIDVTDSGIGIPADKQKRIFRAFRQADGSTSRRYGGTGLGLAISRALARLLGGEIKVLSNPGQGSTFSLLLPDEFDRQQVDEEHIHEDFHDTKEIPVLIEPEITDESGRFQGTNLLLIDDDVASLLSLTPLLESWGISVHAAGDCDEAMEILDEEERIDLMLIDILMPEGDGYDTIARIKKREPDLKIIALTLSLTQLNNYRDIVTQVDGVILKPVDSDELVTSLQSHLTKGT